MKGLAFNARHNEYSTWAVP